MTIAASIATPSPARTTMTTVHPTHAQTTACAPTRVLASRASARPPFAPAQTVLEASARSVAQTATVCRLVGQLATIGPASTARTTVLPARVRTTAAAPTTGKITSGAISALVKPITSVTTVNKLTPRTTAQTTTAAKLEALALICFKSICVAAQAGLLATSATKQLASTANRHRRSKTAIRTRQHPSRPHRHRHFRPHTCCRGTLLANQRWH